jgi:hypothetical protein
VVEDHLAAHRRDAKQAGHAPQVGDAVLGRHAVTPRVWMDWSRAASVASAAAYFAMLAVSPARGESPS